MRAEFKKRNLFLIEFVGEPKIENWMVQQVIRPTKYFNNSNILFNEKEYWGDMIITFLDLHDPDLYQIIESYIDNLDTNLENKLINIKALDPTGVEIGCEVYTIDNVSSLTKGMLTHDSDDICEILLKLKINKVNKKI